MAIAKVHLWLGGAFDPPHYGHLRLAQNLAQQANAIVYLLPTGISAVTKQLSNSCHRIAMLRLACQEFPELQLDLREITSSSNPSVSYTITTLKTIRHEYGDDAILGFAVGVDTFDSMDSWEDPLGITQLANIVVIDRSAFNNHIPVQSSHNTNTTSNSTTGTLTNWSKANTIGLSQLHCHPHGKVAFLNNNRIDLSSTYLRRLIATNQWDKLPGKIAPSVLDYIHEVKLYT